MVECMIREHFLEIMFIYNLYTIYIQSIYIYICFLTSTAYPNMAGKCLDGTCQELSELRRKRAGTSLGVSLGMV